MWTANSFELREITFDYRSAELGFLSTHGVHSGDVCLINNVDRVDFTEDPVQVTLCHCCGFPHCDSGGYVSLRRLGERVLWIPAFRTMADGDWELNEYTPPKFLRQHGVPLFGLNAHTRLRAAVSSVPAMEHVQCLTSCEAVALIQWNAPFSVLGKFPAPPNLNRDRILAVTDGDTSTECDAVQSLLSMFHNSELPLIPIEQNTSPIEFHLDDPRYTSWIPCHRSPKGLALSIDGLGVVGTQTSTPIHAAEQTDEPEPE